MSISQIGSANASNLKDAPSSKSSADSIGSILRLASDIHKINKNNEEQEEGKSNGLGYSNLNRNGTFVEEQRSKSFKSSRRGSVSELINIRENNTLK